MADAPRDGQSTRRLQEFWEGLLDRARQTPGPHAHLAVARKHWVDLPTTKRGLKFSYVIREHDVEVVLVIEGSPGERAYEALLGHRDEVEAPFGAPLDWPTARATFGDGQATSCAPGVTSTATDGPPSKMRWSDASRRFTKRSVLTEAFPATAARITRNSASNPPPTSRPLWSRGAARAWMSRLRWGSWTSLTRVRGRCPGAWVGYRRSASSHLRPASWCSRARRHLERAMRLGDRSAGDST